MKQMVACISALIAAHLTFSTPAEVLFADDPPTSERCAVYAKIVLPMQSPGEGTHPPVESWIARKLSKHGKTEFRAVTHWVRLAEKGEEIPLVWNATVDGMGWGCPVVGKVAERTADGKVRVELSGWLPAVPEIKGQTLPAEIGCHRIAVVDSGIAYIALFVGPPTTNSRPPNDPEKPNPEEQSVAPALRGS